MNGEVVGHGVGADEILVAHQLEFSRHNGGGGSGGGFLAHSLGAGAC